MSRIRVNVYDDLSSYVEFPEGTPAIDVLIALNECTRVFYQRAIKEEALKVNQVPAEISKLVDVIRKQRIPDDN